MAKEITVIKRVSKMGDRVIIEIPKDQRDLFEGKRVKVTILGS